jgi:hypothetical protein
MEKFKFITLNEYNALEPKEQADYDKAVKTFVETFRKSFPNGKTVKYQILRIALPQGNNPRYAVIVKADDFSPSVTNGTSAFQYSQAQVERLAGTANLPSSAVLYACVASSIEPVNLEVTIRPVLAGEEYTKADGTKDTYKVSMLRYENESILMSNDGKDMIAASAQELIKDEMRNAFRRTRTTVTKEEDVTP